MKAFIGLGANLGDRLRSLRHGVAALSEVGEVLAESPVYESPYQPAAAVVGPPQPDYLNAAVLLDTPLSPRDLLAHLLRIEADQGRLREPGRREQPRTLDLDILLVGEHGEQVLNLPQSPNLPTLPALIVPHPRLHQRAFVLLPLLDLDPGLRHPVLGLPLRDLAAAVIGASPLTRPLSRVNF